MNNFILIFVFLSLGMALVRFVRVPQSLPRKLNRFVIYISLPAVVLLHLPKIQLDTSVVSVLLASYATAAVAVVGVVLMGRFYGWSREVDRKSVV